MSSCGRSGRSRATRAGLTLVEVVVGLAILSTLLATALVARARLARQAAEADRRGRAVAAADALLADWWRDPQSLPTSGAGRVPGDRFRWRTRVLSSDAAADLGGRVVRLEVTGSAAPAGAVGETAPLATVDLLLPVPPPAAEAPHATRLP